jgi:hypothetical protein
MTRQNRPWKIQRRTVEASDAQRRWDRAYQYLLRWGSCTLPEQWSRTATAPPDPQEVSHESCGVRPSVYPTASSDTDH